MKFDPDTRVKIIDRAGRRCEICGIAAPVGQIHHRRPRGMGGTKRQESGGAANGLYLHASCHREVESNRERALVRGWLIRQNDDPTGVPVRLSGGWFRLAADGELYALTEPSDQPDPHSRPDQ